MRVGLSVDGMLRASAMRWQDRTAVTAGDGTASYATLDSLVDRAAAFLRSAGAQAGDRIGLARRDSLAFVIWFFAISRAGAVLVPLNPAFSDAEFAHICSDAGVRLVLCDPSLRERFEALSHGGSAFAVAEATGPAEVESLPSHWGHEDRDWASPHAILYTSGTTGRPKGAILSHRSRIVNAMSGQLAYGVSNNTRMLLCAPMFHSGGMILGLINVLSAGGTLILPADAHVDTLRHHVVQDQPNHMILVPTIVYRMLTSPEFCAAARGRGLALLHGASPMSPTMIERLQAELPDARPYHAYGATEICQTTVLPPDEYFRFPTVTGRALPGVDLRVVDEDDRPVPPGAVGEIVTAGPHVFDGYLNDPDKTAAALRGGVFRTGDLATVDEFGHVAIIGRKSDMIISGGYNVYPTEVEAAIEAHPSVQQAAVFGMPHEEWGERVCAAVILRPGTRLTEAELQAFLAGRLARYKQPKAISFQTDLPRTAVGKVQKHRLRELLAGRI